MIILPILTTSPILVSLKGSENVLSELGNERVEETLVSPFSFYSEEFAFLQCVPLFSALQKCHFLPERALKVNGFHSLKYNFRVTLKAERVKTKSSCFHHSDVLIKNCL